MTDVAIRAIVRGAVRTHRLRGLAEDGSAYCACGTTTPPVSYAREQHLEDAIVDALSGRTEVLCATCGHTPAGHIAGRGPCQALTPDGTADGLCPCGTYRAGES